MVLVLCLLACSGSESRPKSPLLANLGDAPERVRAGCAIAARRCSACHPVERVVRAPIVSPQHWENYVHRMLRMPNSPIHPDEVEPILSCLNYRSFGDDAPPIGRSTGEQP